MQTNKKKPKKKNKPKTKIPKQKNEAYVYSGKAEFRRAKYNRETRRGKKCKELKAVESNKLFV